jgi:nucleoside-diphosphate-sugar epimerase
MAGIADADFMRHGWRSEKQRDGKDPDNPGRSCRHRLLKSSIDMKRLLIIGCGDVVSRAVSDLRDDHRICALVRSPDAAARLSDRGVCASRGDLDDPESLQPLAGSADCVIHGAPPANAGRSDRRTHALLAALASKGGAMVPRRILYLSTSGVYGDCGGERVDESRAPAPASDRARRRLDAEETLRAWCTAHGTALLVLRVPGIYAADRLPLARLRSGAPALCREDDVYTNHVHADDLAKIITLAVRCDDARGVLNVNDDTEMKAGDWFDLVADRAGMPRPLRLPREAARQRLSPVQWSFLSESRRLSNGRMKALLGVHLRYPTVCEGVPHAAAATLATG